MILNERFKAPIISFGLGMTMLSCEVGDEVNIWQNEIYNGNEYFLEQEETTLVITLRFSSNVDPTIVTSLFDKVGTYNGRYYFLNSVDLSADVFIFWHDDKWILANLFDPITGTFDKILGELNIDSPLPIGSNWISGGANFFIIDTTANVNPQGFIITATESKQIQVAIVNKNTGHVSKSNKIQLNVT